MQQVLLEFGDTEQSFRNLRDKINQYPGLNIQASVSPSQNRLNLVNLFPSTAGNVALSFSFSDAAVVASNFGMQGGLDADGPGMIKNSFFDKRIPFEALVEPEKYLGETSIGSNVVHSLGNSNATASWDGKGNNLYSKMMSNYLAEIPEFFLQGSQLSTIASEEQGSDNFGVAEYGKPYAICVLKYLRP